MEVMFRVALPVFFSVTVCGALVLPTVTVPKFRLVGVSDAIGPELTTFTVTAAWNSVPLLFHAFTLMVCVPSGTAMLVSMEVTPLNLAEGVELLSTYTQMANTGLLDFVPATTRTGEVTVWPAVGMQMVTDGSVWFSGHWAAARTG